MDQLETPKNVLPFRPVNEPKSPSLTPVENSAFNELARQLAARLENETGAAAEMPATSDAPEAAFEPPAAEASEPARDRPDWLSHPEPPPRGEAARDRTLLDLLPTGVLIYRLDRLLYANPAFLGRVGYDSLHALEEAGGLDALLVEPGVSSASSTSDTGTPVTISAAQSSPGRAPPSATDAHLHAIVWDGDSAHALICLRAARRAGSGCRRCRARAVAGRPCQRRGTRRHPRHHGGGHRDVRRARPPQFLQPQRRGAVRL